MKADKHRTVGKESIQRAPIYESGEMLMSSRIMTNRLHSCSRVLTVNFNRIWCSYVSALVYCRLYSVTSVRCSRRLWKTWPSNAFNVSAVCLLFSRPIAACWQYDILLDFFRLKSQMHFRWLLHILSTRRAKRQVALELYGVTSGGEMHSHEVFVN